MKWLLIALGILLASLWFYNQSKSQLISPPVSFQKPIEVKPPVFKEKLLLMAKLTKPIALAPIYQFKIESKEGNYVTEPFVTKDIRLYRESGERIISDQFLMPENLIDFQKITLLSKEGEILGETTITLNQGFIQDKDGQIIFEISFQKER